MVYSPEFFFFPEICPCFCFFPPLAVKSRWHPFCFFGLSVFSLLFLLLLLSVPRAQNSQQTGFKGNLRLLVKTLEQPHLPFKILPAALSHCLQSLGLLLMFAASAAWLSTGWWRTQCNGSTSDSFSKHMRKGFRKKTFGQYKMVWFLGKLEADMLMQMQWFWNYSEAILPLCRFLPVHHPAATSSSILNLFSLWNHNITLK